MRITAIIAAVVVVSTVAFAQETTDRQDRLVFEVIQLKYISVQTAIALFGGTIIPSQSYGQQMMSRGPRGGYSSRGGNYGYSRSGSGIGGSYTTPRTYGYGSQSPPNYGNQSGSTGYNYFR